MELKTHTAFPHLQMKLESTNHKISVLSAINKLKQAEHQLLQTAKREVVIKRIEQAREAREKEQQKVSEFRKLVRNSLELQKRLKENSLRQRQKQVQKFHEMNMTIRENHFQALNSVKSRQKSENQRIREQIRQSSQKNEELIKQFKRKEFEEKRIRRLKMSQNEEKSKEYVKSFRESRINFIKQQRQKDVQEIQKKIELRYRYLNQLNKTMTKTSMSRSNIIDQNKSESSQHNPKLEKQKGNSKAKLNEKEFEEGINPENKDQKVSKNEEPMDLKVIQIK